MISKVSRPVYTFENSSVAMILPQEILCEIFSYLEEHPVYLTRVAQVCRAWNFAADNHLFWRRLVKALHLPDPKPRAYKYKTYKSIISKNWGKFCTLCHMRRTRSNGYNIRPVLVDRVKINKIDFKASRWFKVVLHEDTNPITQEEQKSKSSTTVNNDHSVQSVIKREELPPQFLKHLLCCRCNSIYSKYIRDEEAKKRRGLLSFMLSEFGITLPDKHVQCDRFILYGEGDPTNITRELALSNFPKLRTRVGTRRK